MDKGRKPLASAAAAAALVLAIGSGTTPAPGDRAGDGGAFPVVPVGGGACIAGLNCGCIRNVTCPGTVRHRPPPPAVKPPPNADPPGAPGPG